MPNPDAVAAFAAQRTSDQAVTVMVVNKQLSGSTPATINVANFQYCGSAGVWQLTSANAIVRLADAPLAGNALSVTLPPQSVTLFVVAKTCPPPVLCSAPANTRIVKD